MTAIESLRQAFIFRGNHNFPIRSVQVQSQPATLEFPLKVASVFHRKGVNDHKVNVYLHNTQTYAWVHALFLREYTFRERLLKEARCHAGR